MIKVNGKVVDINHFPDGTLLIKNEKTDCYPEIEWRYENDAELFALICLTRQLQDQFGERPGLYMPYIPHARMDRVKTNADVFTLKYFAEIINNLDFEEVLVFDPHSHVSEALFKNLRIDDAKFYIDKARLEVCKHPFLMFYPDEGAMKRYSGLVQHPYCFGIKRRNWETGKIEGLDVVGEVEQIKGKDILVVDDICSRGGTFLHSTRKLKELGANKIYLYVSHCENTILEGELLDGDLIEKVFTTNSIFTKSHEKIEVFEL